MLQGVEKEFPFLPYSIIYMHIKLFLKPWLGARLISTVDKELAVFDP